jgi:hypothetical protein
MIDLKTLTTEETLNLLLSAYLQTSVDKGYVEALTDPDELRDYLKDIEGEFWYEGSYSFNKGYTYQGITITSPASYGGEGQGDELWVVFALTDGTDTRYFRKDGYYASYDGGAWDGDFREVTPQDRLVTFYE